MRYFQDFRANGSTRMFHQREKRRLDPKKDRDGLHSRPAAVPQTGEVGHRGTICASFERIYSHVDVVRPADEMFHGEIPFQG